MTTKAPKPAKPAKDAAKTYILFGADEYAKPRGARFLVLDPEPLVKAKASLHLRLFEVTDEDMAEVAARLPEGRLHASGKGLVPYIKPDVYYDVVAATVGDPQVPANPGPAPQDLPRSWDEIATGHFVIARETLKCGWWEAIVVERTGDLLTVQYRDYPQYGTMVRHRSAIALISPPSAQA
jgi:hypothetical protein